MLVNLSASNLTQKNGAALYPTRLVLPPTDQLKKAALSSRYRLNPDECILVDKI